MLTTLLLTLAFTPADSVALRAPIYCPENEARYALLGPTFGAADVATNTSIWFSENTVYAPVELILTDATNATVAFDLEHLVGARYTLVKLTPRGDLAVNTLHKVASRSTPNGDQPIGEFTTGSAPDLLAPAVPVVTDMYGGTDGCTGYGLVVVTAANSEPVLTLAEDPTTGELVAFDQTNYLTVPSQEGDTVKVDLVRMDLAGNRSDKLSAESKVETRSFDNGGCTCVPAARGRLALLCLPMIFVAVSLLRSRGSRRRSHL